MRREYKAFYEEHPSAEKTHRFMMFLRSVPLPLLKCFYRRILAGSELWHSVQHRLSLKPSCEIYDKYRTAFYECTLQAAKDVYVCPGSCLCYPNNIVLGDNVFINRNVYITARAPITIGSNVMIGANTIINSGSHIYSDKKIWIRNQGHKVMPITIGDDVWIGANVTIMPGVVIGTGAVVGAGSVVTHTVSPYCVVAGVPARPLKYRGGNDEQ